MCDRASACGVRASARPNRDRCLVREILFQLSKCERLPKFRPGGGRRARSRSDSGNASVKRFVAPMLLAVTAACGSGGGGNIQLPQTTLRVTTIGDGLV